MAVLKSNYKNSVIHLKQLIGRAWSDPAVQRERDSHVPYKLVELPGDRVGVAVQYDGEERQFTPEALMAMLIVKLDEIAKANNDGVGISEAVLSVPASFDQRQRLAMLDAAQIAGVSCLRLLNENTATALGYGIFKSANREFSDENDTHIMFVDVGHSSASAAVVAFRNGTLRVLSNTWAEGCGGRDIDYALAQTFASDFQSKTGVDAWGNRKARIKLLAAAEKAKKVLSPYGVTQASASVECLAEDQDFSMTITLEQFDELCEPVVAPIRDVVSSALSQAGVAMSDLAAVEVVGGASRPRVVKRAIAQALGLELNEATAHGLRTTVNQDECVARGAALQCAMLSSAFKVKPYEVQDAASRGVQVVWDADPNAPDSETSHDLFAVGDAFPVTRRMTFRRKDGFKLYAACTGEAAGSLGTYAVSAPPADAVEEGERAPKLRVDFKYDKNGIFGVSKAEVLRPVKPEPEASPAPEESPKSAAVEGAQQEEAAAAAAAEGDAPAEADAAAAAASPAAPEQPKKTKYKREELPVATVSAVTGMPSDALSAARAAEERMQAADAKIRATQNMRNDLEAYIYSTRSALRDSLSEYISAEDSESFSAQLTAMEDWLYEDGFDVSLEVYSAKLAELKARGDPVERRRHETEGRNAAVSALLDSIESYRSVLTSNSEAYEHLTDSDRDVLRAACSEAEAWLADMQSKQAALTPKDDPVLTIEGVAEHHDALERECMKIKNKPKPKPPAPEPAPAPAPADAAEAGEQEGAEAAPEPESATANPEAAGQPAEAAAE